MSTLFTRLAKWFHAQMPTHEQLTSNRYTAPVAARQELFRFTRRSVPRGVAVGTFVGIFALIPGIQIVGAVLMCVPFRGNIPLAIAMTFLSIPPTTPLIVLGSIWVGNHLGFHADISTFWSLYETHASVGRWLRWLLSDAAPSLVIGLFVVSVVAATIGYFLAMWFWRGWIGRKHRARQLRPRRPNSPAHEPVTAQEPVTEAGL